MRNPVLIGGTAVVLTLVGGYALVIAPQATSTAAVHSQLQSVEASNAAASLRVPALKAQLADITGTVAELRALSGQVPPVIDMPGLYASLDAVAAAAGAGVSVTNVSVTVPKLLTDPAAAAATPTPAATAGAATTDPAPVVHAPAAVLASYQLTMEVTATPAQASKFLTALGLMPRMSVVSSSSLTAGAAGTPGSVKVLATLYLQQVDVDALAAQIEALAAAKSPTKPASSTTASPAPSSPVTISPSGLPTP
jgi:hypothetical protein